MALVVPVRHVKMHLKNQDGVIEMQKISITKTQTRKNVEAPEACLRNHQGYSEEPSGLLPSVTNLSNLTTLRQSPNFDIASHYTALRLSLQTSCSLLTLASLILVRLPHNPAAFS